MFVGRFQKAANFVETNDYCLVDASLDHRALKAMEETAVDWRRFRKANSRLSVRSI